MAIVWSQDKCKSWFSIQHSSERLKEIPQIIGANGEETGLLPPEHIFSILISFCSRKKTGEFARVATRLIIVTIYHEEHISYRIQNKSPRS